MNFKWLDSKSPVLPDCWSLHLMDGTRLVDRLGVMYRVLGGYTVMCSPAITHKGIFHLPANLTLDEAKSAAKLILATGGAHDGR
jgi:hypothetical protein